jgi:hypothetical protein
MTAYLICFLVGFGVPLHGMAWLLSQRGTQSNVALRMVVVLAFWIPGTSGFLSFG